MTTMTARCRRTNDYEAMITEFAGDPARGVTPALSEEDEERLAHEAKFVSKEVIDALAKAGFVRPEPREEPVDHGD